MSKKNVNILAIYLDNLIININQFKATLFLISFKISAFGFIIGRKEVKKYKGSKLSLKFPDEAIDN